MLSHPLFRAGAWLLVGINTFLGVTHIHTCAQTGIAQHLLLGLISLGLAVGLLYLLSLPREG